MHLLSLSSPLSGKSLIIHSCQGILFCHLERGFPFYYLIYGTPLPFYHLPHLIEKLPIISHPLPLLVEVKWLNVFKETVYCVVTTILVQFLGSPVS